MAEIRDVEHAQSGQDERACDDRRVHPARYLAVVCGVALQPVAGLVVAGLVRFLLARRFGLSDAVWILVDVPLAALLLLVADYVHFHTRINVLVFLMVFLLLAISSSAFSVGLGIVLMGTWIYNTTH